MGARYHAGIATQNVVEKALKDSKTRHDFSRDEFVNKVWDWKHDYGSRITTQIRRWGRLWIGRVNDLQWMMAAKRRS